MRRDATDFTAALLPGPWEHRFVSANGCRFHLAVIGPTAGPPTTAPVTTPTAAPLVLLVHGFGQFWWAWRDVMAPLAAAGYQVAALDLRGAGASDKPPTGYDIPTRTRDIAAVIRSLGRQRAVIVGHGTGGEAAWAMAGLQPAATMAVAAIASPHPAWAHSSFASSLTPRAHKFLAQAQLPGYLERQLCREGTLAGVFAAGRLGRYEPPSADPFTAEVVAKYLEVMRIPFAAHTSLEALRWLVRSAPRPDGHRYRAALRQVSDVPALQVQGARDGFIRGRRSGWGSRDITAFTDAEALRRNLTTLTIDDGGHYLPEEHPGPLAEALTNWLPAASGR